MSGFFFIADLVAVIEKYVNFLISCGVVSA